MASNYSLLRYERYDSCFWYNMIRNRSLKNKRFTPGIAGLWVKLFAIFIAFLIFIALMALLVKESFESYILAFDQKVFTYLSNYISPRNTSIMKAFTVFGSPEFLISAFVLLL